MICFLGSSHAAIHLREAARERGLELTDDRANASLIFVSEDTPTGWDGTRDLSSIRYMLEDALEVGPPVILTSQVPPGFTRSFRQTRERLFHQAETLRIKDAAERALNPDYIAVGCPTYQSYDLLPAAYRKYLEAFRCPVHVVTYEDAEYSKIAVNMFLAAQVDATNKLSGAARKAEASWPHVAEILKLDKRIGPHAYLEPGRWQDSKHLMRDHVTLEKIIAR